MCFYAEINPNPFFMLPTFTVEYILQYLPTLDIVCWDLAMNGAVPVTDPFLKMKYEQYWGKYKDEKQLPMNKLLKHIGPHLKCIVYFMHRDICKNFNSLLRKYCSQLKALHISSYPEDRWEKDYVSGLTELSFTSHETNAKLRFIIHRYIQANYKTLKKLTLNVDLSLKDIMDNMELIRCKVSESESALQELNITQDMPCDFERNPFCLRKQTFWNSYNKLERISLTYMHVDNLRNLTAFPNLKVLTLIYCIGDCSHLLKFVNRCKSIQVFILKDCSFIEGNLKKFKNAVATANPSLQMIFRNVNFLDIRSWHTFEEDSENGYEENDSDSD